ncbi:hypothetical protein N7495_001028 [Penicillium taxi]|uniref:uncharacterized protein n=1 Tax=Penicillium taxi TaxID=168475 RepID=UPI0025456ACC|nr:uncharacterized protein N7495_001028 [Penicillium taxi]KAJ5908346.1 hypothetical protein N7495_001028 [Penicillium taxi]
MVRNFSGPGAFIVGPGVSNVASDDAKNQTKWPKNPKDVVVNEIDTGALINEMAALHLLPGKLELPPREFIPEKRVNQNPEGLIWALNENEEPPKIPEGTYRGTRLALTQVYDLIEQRYVSFMDIAQIESSIPSAQTLDKKQELFKFTQAAPVEDGGDGYPPHLNLAINLAWANSMSEADVSQKSNFPVWGIFDFLRLAQLKGIMLGILPGKLGGGTPDVGKKLADVEAYNRKSLETWGWVKRIQFDVFDRRNIGELKDWYSDARFAQQHFTGSNPTTIEQASDGMIRHFIDAAKTQEDKVAKDTIIELSIDHRKSLYMQDCSYFRKAAGLDLADDIR